jgi:type II secretory pathway pseudopilin PulG
MHLHVVVSAGVTVPVAMTASRFSDRRAAEQQRRSYETRQQQRGVFEAHPHILLVGLPDGDHSRIGMNDR